MERHYGIMAETGAILEPGTRVEFIDGRMPEVGGG